MIAILHHRKILMSSIVAFLVLFGIFMFMSFFLGHTSTTTHQRGEVKYRLTLHVKNWVDGTPVKSIPIEVIQKVDSNEKRITLKDTDENGTVVFDLPVGKYRCQVPKDIDWTGGVDVELNTHSEVELKVLPKVSS